MLIRPLELRDNPAVEAVIRTVMPEFGASGPGFAIHDAEVSDMFAAYCQPRWAYFVVEVNGKVAGGGGVAPLQGGDLKICELKKMYFLPEARRLGLGKKVLDQCLDAARTTGFRTCYLETLKGMTRARALYEKSGFLPLNKPMGATGHFGCDAWYAREL